MEAFAFQHPLFADGWHGCTTESLRWQDDDYDTTAGVVAVKPATQAEPALHLFSVDLAVRTNDGREIVLERIEGGKLLSCLLRAEREGQARKGPGATVHRCMPTRTT